MRDSRSRSGIAVRLGSLTALLITTQAFATEVKPPPIVEASCASFSTLGGSIGSSLTLQLSGTAHTTSAWATQCIQITTTYPVRVRLQFTETVDSQNMGTNAYAGDVVGPPFSGSPYELLPPVASCSVVGVRTGETFIDLKCNSSYLISFGFWWTIDTQSCTPGMNNGTVVANVMRSPLGLGTSPASVVAESPDPAAITSLPSSGSSEGSRVPGGVLLQRLPGGAPRPWAPGNPAAMPLRQPLRPGGFMIPEDGGGGGGPPADFTNFYDAIQPYFYYQTVNGVTRLQVNSTAAAAAHVTQEAIDFGLNVADVYNQVQQSKHDGVSLVATSIRLGALQAMTRSSTNRNARYPCGSIDNPLPTPPYHCSNYYSDNRQDVINALVAGGYHLTGFPGQATNNDDYTKATALPGCTGHPLAGRYQGLIRSQAGCYTYIWQGPEPNPELFTYWNDFPQDSQGSSIYWPSYCGWWHLVYTDYQDVVPGPQCPDVLSPNLVAGSADESSSAFELAIPVESGFVVNAWPNPSVGHVTFAGRAPNLEGFASVLICDAAGRRVFEQEVATAAGRFVVDWDGSDFRGGRARPGLYFARVRSQVGTAHKTVILTQ